MTIWKKQKLKITMILVALFILSVLTLERNQKSIDMGLESMMPIGEITVETPVEFLFTADQDNLSGMELKFATYARENLTGNIDLRVTIEDKNIFTDTIDVSNLKDNSFYLIDFPTYRDSYGKEVRIFLTTSDLQAGNAVTLWSENTVRDGTKTVFGGKKLENTIVYKEQVETGLNVVSIMLLIILLFHVLLITIYIRVDDERVSELLHVIESRELRVVIYFCFGILLIAKMNFYSNYVANFPDETAHVAYVAYLEETGKIIPEFENMYNFNEDIDNSVVTIQEISKTGVNYLGHSPLYYLILKMTNNIHILPNRDVRVNLLFLRWITQGIGLVGVMIYFYLGYKNIKSVALTICYASVTTLVPMFAYGLSGVTNDTLALVGVAVLFWGMSEFEKGESSYRVFFLIGLGVFLSGLSKLTCGMVIGIAGICYILYLVKKGQFKRIICREFVVTLPFYILLIGYYVYILKTYGVLQPGLSVVAPEYFKQTDFYVIPENRVSMSFFEFTKSYWNGFFDTWISIRSAVSLSKDGKIWKLSGIGTCSILLFCFIGAGISLLKEKEGLLKVSYMFVAGVLIAAIYQFYRSYMVIYLKNGRFGSYQSRYYLCCIGIMAFLVCYVFELMANAMVKKIDIESQRDQLIIKLGGIFVCLCYAWLLLYDDIIYFLINFSQYI